MDDQYNTPPWTQDLPTKTCSLPDFVQALEEHLRTTPAGTSTALGVSLCIGPLTDPQVRLVAAYAFTPRPWGPMVAQVTDHSDLRHLATVLHRDDVRAVIHHLPLAAPRLVAAGVSPPRVWDTRSVERLLLHTAGTHGPASLAASWARAVQLGELPNYLHRAHLRNLDPEQRADVLAQDPHRDCQQPLRPDGHLHHLAHLDATDLTLDSDHVGDVRVTHAAMAAVATLVIFHDQLRRLRAIGGRLPLLAEAVSDTHLTAALLTHHGMPCDVAAAERALTTVLGPRPAPGEPYTAVTAAQEEVYAAFNGTRFCLDDDHACREAFHAAGFPLWFLDPTTLDNIRHPGGPALLAYRRIARLAQTVNHVWLEDHAHAGRLHLPYVPEATAAGRWAHGPHTLQVAKILKAACVPEQGQCLVVAAFQQLLPRVLAQLSCDPELIQKITRCRNLYTALAHELGCSRHRAEHMFLAGLYGKTTSGIKELTALFPVAATWLNTQEKTGREGGAVYSVLGRRSPDRSNELADLADRFAKGPVPPQVTRRLRKLNAQHSLSCRRFPLHASASDLTLVTLMLIRRNLPTGSRLARFTDKEYVVETSPDLLPAVHEVLEHCAREATRMVFGSPQVPFDLKIHTLGGREQQAT